MKSKRCQQVNGLLKVEISDIIRSKLKDPSVGFITIIDVDVSKDLRYAKVYVSVLGDHEQKLKSLKALQRAKNYIHNELGNRIRLRYLPMLSFCLDESLEYAAKIEEILNKLDLNDSSNAD